MAQLWAKAPTPSIAGQGTVFHVVTWQNVLSCEPAKLQLWCAVLCIIHTAVPGWQLSGSVTLHSVSKNAAFATNLHSFNLCKCHALHMQLAGLAVYVLWDRLCVEEHLQHELLGSFILGLNLLLLFCSTVTAVKSLDWGGGLNLTDRHCSDDKIRSFTAVVVPSGFS